ncbi:MAG: nuclear transport factor 2 family protein [Acidimicrobiales bacterium]
MEVALRELAVRYARAVDRRDVDTFLAVFEPDAVVVVRRPSPTDRPSEIRGHDRLARIPEVIARYARTFHFLGQSSYRDLGDEAEGEVYCIAHHLDVSAEAATDLVMFIRYEDRYARHRDGTWRIRRREVLVDWTETRPADAPDEVEGDGAR